MSTFVRCESCRRHVRIEEPSCPFCDAAPPEEGIFAPGRTGRLGRAAAFAFSTALAGCVPIAAYGVPPGDSGPSVDAGRAEADAGTDAGEADAGEVDAGTDAGTDAGPEDAGAEDAGMADAGTDSGGAGLDGGIVPPYGAPALPTALV
ncbi:MAG: hypothetical protein AB8I08_27365 [Sandaracinaceae bacterium]